MLSESAQETISGILEEAHIVASMNDDSEEMERIKVAIADLEAERTAPQAGAAVVPESLRYILMRYSQDHSGEDHQARVREVRAWLKQQPRPATGAQGATEVSE